MKLKVNIWRKKNVVVAEVVEQCESLRSPESDPKPKMELKEKNNYYILSNLHPYMTCDTLSIRGYQHEFDKALICHDFKSEAKAIIWCEHITAMINEINEENEESGFTKIM